MFLALKRLIWRIYPLPSDRAERDLELMRRAGDVLDAYHDGRRPTVKGIRLATKILRRHSLPVHALRSMIRERDQDAIDQSTRAQRELAEQTQPRAVAS